jgi:hypothetical protein
MIIYLHGVIWDCRNRNLGCSIAAETDRVPVRQNSGILVARRICCSRRYSDVVLFNSSPLEFRETIKFRTGATTAFSHLAASYLRLRMSLPLGCCVNSDHEHDQYLSSPSIRAFCTCWYESASFASETLSIIAFESQATQLLLSQPSWLLMRDFSR